MKNINTYLILLFTCITLTSCKSSNKKPQPSQSVEDISIPDSSAAEDEEIEVIPETKEKVSSTKTANTQENKAETAIPKPIKKDTPKSKIENTTAKVDKQINQNEPTPPNTKEEIVQKPIVDATDKLKESNVETKKINDKAENTPKEIVNVEKTTKPEKPQKPMVPVGYPNHKLFDSFLQKYVSSNGVVDYASIKKNVGQLDDYISTLEGTEFNTTWSRKDKLSFWINAYNAYTIRLIINNYPVAKITDLHGGKPWDYKWIKLNGKTLSLNNIENDIIRPEFKEPRIHFAVNCAAKSCPPLLNAAYTADNLESKLDSQTKKFINNSNYNTLGKSEITLSKIFEWYAVDFGDVASYIAKYANATVKPTAKIKYNEYDWNLNGK